MILISYTLRNKLLGKKCTLKGSLWLAHFVLTHFVLMEMEMGGIETGRSVCIFSI